MDENNKVLVTGATGNIGRHVVSGLHETGTPVRVLVRDPAMVYMPDGVEVVRGDLTDAGSVEAALAGVEAVFLLWPFASAEGAKPVVDAIAKHASRAVYVSAMSAEQGFWGEIEHLIEQSGLEWTFLRAGGLAANTLGWADQVREGVVRWPYGGAARSLVHERDIAAVAVLALTEDTHVGAKYVLTGPETVTQADQVRLIGDAIGRPVRWEELAPQDARKLLLTKWGDAAFVDSALAYWSTLETNPEPVTGTVEQVTGRPARTFGQWARDHADDFLPPATAEVGKRYASGYGRGALRGRGSVRAQVHLQRRPGDLEAVPVHGHERQDHAGGGVLLPRALNW